LVKGGLDDLTKELKEKLIGYKSSNFGFEGLIDSKNRDHISKDLLVEKPSMDDIVIFYINGKRD
jgi:ABC-2 type transport system ATP-binding protein